MEIDPSQEIDAEDEDINAEIANLLAEVIDVQATLLHLMRMAVLALITVAAGLFLSSLLMVVLQ